MNIFYAQIAMKLLLAYTNKRRIKYLKMFWTCPRQLSNFFQEYLSLEVVPNSKIRNTHRPQMMMP